MNHNKKCCIRALKTGQTYLVSCVTMAYENGSNDYAKHIIQY